MFKKFYLLSLHIYTYNYIMGCKYRKDNFLRWMIKVSVNSELVWFLSLYFFPHLHPSSPPVSREIVLNTCNCDNAFFWRNPDTTQGPYTHINPGELLLLIYSILGINQFIFGHQFFILTKKCKKTHYLKNVRILFCPGDFFFVCMVKILCACR